MMLSHAVYVARPRCWAPIRCHPPRVQRAAPLPSPGPRLGPTGPTAPRRSSSQNLKGPCSTSFSPFFSCFFTVFDMLLPCLEAFRALQNAQKARGKARRATLFHLILAARALEEHAHGVIRTGGDGGLRPLLDALANRYRSPASIMLHVLHTCHEVYKGDLHKQHIH